MPDAPPERRFVLLGNGPQTKVWLDAIRQSGRHHILGALASNSADGTAFDHWQQVAADDAVDAAILFDSTDELSEAAGQLASRGKALVVDGECRLPSSVVSELGLLDAEGTAAIVPLFEWRAIPALERLRQLVADGELGELVLIRIERAIVCQDRELSDTAVSEFLLSDVDVLRWMGGDFSQVALFRTGTRGDRFAGQTLNLSGEGLPDATCHYRPGNVGRWKCEIQGTSSTAAISMDDDEAQLTIDGERVQVDPAPLPSAELSLGLLDDALARCPGSLRWRDRVRVHEIQGAMRRSLKRRRTIDLHFETTSERSQFKTQMATVGCFVLVYTFFASVFLLLAGAVLDPRDPLQREAEAAGFLVPRTDFDAATNQLTAVGEQRLRGIADRWQGARAVVVVEGEPSGGDDEGELSARDRARLDAVRRQLRESGVSRVDERTVVRRLAGHGFQTLMAIGRIVAFAPLGVFLLMQLLLIIARPAETGRP